MGMKTERLALQEGRLVAAPRTQPQLRHSTNGAESDPKSASDGRASTSLS
jgi:hypothetical protein